jgi:glycosyltransferase involved in cell wall biosynthesis
MRGGVQVAKTISVVIPTLGRSKELIDTVSALMKQTRVPDEIVIIDQNQPELDDVNRFLAGIPIVKHFRGESPGVSINYNRCFERASGDVVLYLDDDIIPDPRLVEFHLENYEHAQEDLGGVAGRVEQPQGDLPSEQIRNLGKYHRWTGRITARFNATKKADVQIAPGGNMSFYRYILFETQGFDEGFGGNGYFFETDGTYRVYKKGYRIAFDPRAQVKHLMAPAGGARIRDKSVHTYFYVKNGIRLYRRHSPTLGYPLVAARMLFYVAAKAAYNLNPRILFKGLQGFIDGWTQDMRIQSNVSAAVGRK